MKCLRDIPLLKSGIRESVVISHIFQQRFLIADKLVIFKMVVHWLTIPQLTYRSFFKELHACRYTVRLLSQRFGVCLVDLYVLLMK
jgi:hypothetical protein